MGEGSSVERGYICGLSVIVHIFLIAIAVDIALASPLFFAWHSVMRVESELFLHVLVDKNKNGWHGQTALVLP